MVAGFLIITLKAIVLIFSHTRPGPYMLSRHESVRNQFVFAVGTQYSSEMSALALPGCYVARSSVGYRHYGSS
jgi:hypothetical protein